MKLIFLLSFLISVFVNGDELYGEEWVRAVEKKLQEKESGYDHWSYGGWGSEKHRDPAIVGIYKHDTEDIYRPCKLHDYDCIRKVLASNSYCSPTYGPAPDPLVVEKYTLFYPAFNMSIVSLGVTMEGLDSAVIKEFYLNKDTGNVVLAFDLKNLKLTLPKSYFVYRRVAKEPIVLQDYAAVDYGRTIITAAIPKIPKLRLELADVNIYIPNGNPPYVIGPNAGKSKDPDVIEAFKQLNTFVPLAVREETVQLARIFTQVFVQKKLCDFGVEVVSS